MPDRLIMAFCVFRWFCPSTTYENVLFGAYSVTDHFVWFFTLCFCTYHVKCAVVCRDSHPHAYWLTLFSLWHSLSWPTWILWLLWCSDTIIFLPVCGKSGILWLPGQYLARRSSCLVPDLYRRAMDERFMLQVAFCLAFHIRGSRQLHLCSIFCSILSMDAVGSLSWDFLGWVIH